MAAISAEYAAGLFDGEGTLGVYLNGNKASNVWHVRISVEMGSEHCISALHERYGGHVYSRIRPQGRREMFHWQLRKRDDVKRFLDDILPFAIEKADQIIVCLGFLSGSVDGPDANQACTDLKFAII